MVLLGNHPFLMSNSKLKFGLAI